MRQLPPALISRAIGITMVIAGVHVASRLRDRPGIGPVTLGLTRADRAG
jgi:hypothetical protein